MDSTASCAYGAFCFCMARPMKGHRASVGDPYLSPRRNLLLKISNPNEQARLAAQRVKEINELRAPDSRNPLGNAVMASSRVVSQPCAGAAAAIPIGNAPKSWSPQSGVAVGTTGAPNSLTITHFHQSFPVFVCRSSTAVGYNEAS